MLQDSGRMAPGPPPTVVLRGEPMRMTPGGPRGGGVLRASFKLRVVNKPVVPSSLVSKPAARSSPRRPYGCWPASRYGARWWGARDARMGAGARAGSHVVVRAPRPASPYGARCVADGGVLATPEVMV